MATELVRGHDGAHVKEMAVGYVWVDEGLLMICSGVLPLWLALPPSIGVCP